ncbi:MAG TPA: S41 family peptidase [Gemmatimonadales bacterium]
MTRFSLTSFTLAASLLGGAGPGRNAWAIQGEPIPLPNLNFESSPRNNSPPGWAFTTPRGYAMTLVDSGAHGGKRAVRLEQRSPAFEPFGTILRVFDAREYRGKRIMFRAWVRTEVPAETSVGLWLRVDRADSRAPVGLFDNMQNRPIRSTRWRPYQIVGMVDFDAAAINLGMLIHGPGRAWLDDVSVSIVHSDADTLMPPLNPTLAAYLDSALNIMQTNSVRLEHVDWRRIRAQARDAAIAGGAEHLADVYPVVDSALAQLEDPHGQLIRPGTASRPSPSEDFADSSARLLEARYGYVRIPHYGGVEFVGSKAFAMAVQRAVQRLDQAGACGWVVDLRGNDGSNMWPMLAGIGPVLGDGVAGGFVAPHNERSTWSYAQGAARAPGGATVDLGDSAYHLQHADPPVAVLTDSLTANSGEALAISFRGRPRSRSFGAATAGRSSTTGLFALPDSALIALTTQIDADRTGKQYGDRVQPDEKVRAGGARGPDAVLAAAQRWLADQPPCKSAH